MITPATLFEELGFNYYGPIDGHDLEALVPTLQNLNGLKGPLFLHVITKKGAGYQLAEQDPILYHGPGKFDPSVGIQASKDKQHLTYTQVFGQWLCTMAEQDSRLTAITPAMREGSGLVEFEQRFPERYFDVGIAEQHAITFAAGMACEGLKPVVAIYSTFLQRGYDQFIHDVALQNLDVTFAIDRAGLVGADGPTHAGSFDLAYLRCVPNVIIAAPSDEYECWQLLTTVYQYNGCAAIRYPRGKGLGLSLPTNLTALSIGQAKVRYVSQYNRYKLVVLAFGSLVQSALFAGYQLDIDVVDMRWVKPLDHDLIASYAKAGYRFVTLEEGCLMGGAGSAVVEYLHALGTVSPVLQLGLPDHFIDHGDSVKLLADVGLDGIGVQASIERYYEITRSQHSSAVVSLNSQSVQS